MNTSQNQEINKPINIDENEIKRLNQEMITSDLITPDKLYIELALLKDINIGTILSFLKERKKDISQEDYNSLYEQIIQKLDEYNDRSFDDFEAIFPFMNITNEQILERKHDSKYSSFIFHVAPITKYIDILKAQIAVNVNHSAVIGKTDSIELNINTYPLRLSKEDEYVVGFFFSNTLKVNVRVMYLDMQKLKLSDIIKYDEVYTYHYKDIFDVEDIRHAYTEMKFIKKRLYAPRLFGFKIDKNKNVDQEALFIQSRLDVLTNFKYVHPRLFSAIPPTEKETKVNG